MVKCWQSLPLASINKSCLVIILSLSYIACKRSSITAFAWVCLKKCIWYLVEHMWGYLHENLGKGLSGAKLVLVPQSLFCLIWAQKFNHNGSIEHPSNKKSLKKPLCHKTTVCPQYICQRKGSYVIWNIPSMQNKHKWKFFIFRPKKPRYLGENDPWIQFFTNKGTFIFLGSSN